MISAKLRDLIAASVTGLGIVLFIADALPFLHYTIPVWFGTGYLPFIGTLYVLPARKDTKNDDK